MVAFTGVCRVHRAEIMQLRGAWQDAIEEAQRARERSQGIDQRATAAAFYQQAEVHRLRGEFAAAEEAYRSASQCGLDPQPGLALLRAGARTHRRGGALRSAARERDGRPAAAREAAARLRRDHAGRRRPRGSAQRLPRAGGDRRELRQRRAGRDGRARPRARSSWPKATLRRRSARCAARFEVWQQVEAPYVAARVRVLIGLACRALGDDDGGGLELDAARAVFEQLGAAPDLARIDALAEGAAPAHRHGLTPRELQVLRLVAAGKTNKAIAAELFLSEKTIDRHVSNIFTKLDVPSRAAATAYAYEHKHRPAQIGVFTRSAASPLSRSVLCGSTPRTRTGGRHGQAQVQRTAPDKARRGPETDRARARVERLLAGMPVTERRLQLAGVSTAVLEGGDGPPVVLLHGPMGLRGALDAGDPGTRGNASRSRPRSAGPRRVGGDRRWSDGRRTRAGVARRADRADLRVAAGRGGAIARRRHRRALRDRPRRPAEPARARRHVRPESVRASA